MKINISLLSGIYVMSVLATMVFVFLENTYGQIALKVCNIIILIAMYLTETRRGERKILYITMLLLLAVGHINFVFPNLSNFDFTFFPYLIAHCLLIALIYNDYLEEKSIKDLLVFTLPFSLAFLIFSTLLNFSVIWFVKSFFLGLAACINCGIVLLVYARKSSIKNYLLFFGVFMWFLVDAFCATFLFGEGDEIFYLLTLILDWIAQFMICWSLITKETLQYR